MIQNGFKISKVTRSNLQHGEQITTKRLRFLKKSITDVTSHPTSSFPFSCHTFSSFVPLPTALPFFGFFSPIRFLIGFFFLAAFRVVNTDFGCVFIFLAALQILLIFGLTIFLPDFVDRAIHGAGEFMIGPMFHLTFLGTVTNDAAASAVLEFRRRIGGFPMSPTLKDFAIFRLVATLASFV